MEKVRPMLRFLSLIENSNKLEEMNVHQLFYPLLILALGAGGLCSTVQAQGGMRELEYRARQHDDPVAMRKLGLIHYRGLYGYKRSYKYAAGWFEKAVREGDAESMLLLGDCYRQGKGVSKSTYRAFDLYKDAMEADKGKRKEALKKIKLLPLSDTLSWWQEQVEERKDKEAAYFLATVDEKYWDGRFSQEKADIYMVKAARMGHKKAQSAIESESLSRYLPAREKIARDGSDADLVKLAEELLASENCTPEHRKKAVEYYEEAAEDGNYDAKRWLEKEQDKSWEELADALESNQFSRTVELLRQMESPKGRDLSAVLLVALKKNRLDKKIVELILEKGADKSYSDEDRMTLLMAAISGDQPEDVVKLFIQENHHLNAALRDSGQTALMLAVQAGKPELVEALIKNGANIYAEDNNKKTALDYASSPKVREIISRAAEEKKQAEINEIFNLGTQDQFGKLVELIARQDVDTLRYLIQKGMSVKMCDAGFRDTFREASASRIEAQVCGALFEKEIMKHRFTAGFTPRVWFTYGSSLLFFAVDVGNPEIVKMLIAAGAPVNATDNFGLNALAKAVLQQKQEIVKILLESGAASSIDVAIHSECYDIVYNVVKSGSAAELRELYSNVNVLLNPPGETTSVRELVLELEPSDGIRKLVEPYLQQSSPEKGDAASNVSKEKMLSTDMLEDESSNTSGEKLWNLSQEEQKNAELGCYIGGSVMVLLGLFLLGKSRSNARKKRSLPTRHSQNQHV